MFLIKLYWKILEHGTLALERDYAIFTSRNPSWNVLDARGCQRLSDCQLLKELGRLWSLQKLVVSVKILQLLYIRLLILISLVADYYY